MNLKLPPIFGRRHAQEPVVQEPAAASRSTLLTISDPTTTTVQASRGSFGKSFHALFRGAHVVRNIGVLAVVALLAGVGTFAGVRSDLLMGLFRSTPNYERLSTLKLSPDVRTVTVGETFDVQIRLNTNGQPTGGADVFISYDSTVLEVVDQDATLTGSQVKPGTLYPQYGGNLADPASNTITLIGFTSLGGGDAVSTTSDTLFGTITLRARKAAASTEMKFLFEADPAIILSTDSNVTMTLGPDETGDVLKSVTNAVYTVSGAASEITVEITTNDGRDFSTDQSSRTIRGVTSLSTKTLRVDGQDADEFTPGDERWSHEVDLDRGDNDITVVARNADGTKSDEDDITITREEEEDADPTDDDTDDDGLPDSFEVRYELNINNPLDGRADTDGDGCTNVEEFMQSTDPTSTDTDSDGMPDCFEIRNNLDPLDPSDASANQDDDGCTNYDEFLRSTSVTSSDTDGDGVEDCVDEHPLVSDSETAATTPTTPTTPAPTTSPSTPAPAPASTPTPVQTHALDGTGPGTWLATVTMLVSFLIAAYRGRKYRTSVTP